MCVLFLPNECYNFFLFAHNGQRLLYRVVENGRTANIIANTVRDEIHLFINKNSNRKSTAIYYTIALLFLRACIRLTWRESPQSVKSDCGTIDDPPRTRYRRLPCVIIMVLFFFLLFSCFHIVLNFYLLLLFSSFASDLRSIAHFLTVTRTNNAHGKRIISAIFLQIITTAGNEFEIYQKWCSFWPITVLIGEEFSIH